MMGVMKGAGFRGGERVVGFPFVINNGTVNTQVTCLTRRVIRDVVRRCKGEEDCMLKKKEGV